MTRVKAVFGLLLSVFSKANSYFCDGGHYCPSAKECCDGGCCFNKNQRPDPDDDEDTDYEALNEMYNNNWHFWMVICALSLLMAVAFWFWRQRDNLCLPCHQLRRSGSLRSSTGSCYVPPHYSRCNSFLRPPPPYSEVKSKPSLYPLVITYQENDKTGSNYLMVHYFRDYKMAKAGTLAFTSDDIPNLHSSMNEANSAIPPPYTTENMNDLHLSKNFTVINCRSTSSPHLFSPFAPPRDKNGRSAKAKNPKSCSESIFEPEAPKPTEPLLPMEDAETMWPSYFENPPAPDAARKNKKLNSSPPMTSSPNWGEPSYSIKYDFPVPEHFAKSDRPCVWSYSEPTTPAPGELPTIGQYIHMCTDPKNLLSPPDNTSLLDDLQQIATDSNGVPLIKRVRL